MNKSKQQRNKACLAIGFILIMVFICPDQIGPTLLLIWNTVKWASLAVIATLTILFMIGLAASLLYNNQALVWLALPALLGYWCIGWRGAVTGVILMCLFHDTFTRLLPSKYAKFIEGKDNLK